MKNKFTGMILTFLIASIFGFQSIGPGNLTYAQSLYHVENVPGSGGSSNTDNSSGSSHTLATTMFVLCGVAVASLLVYKFFIQEKDTTGSQKADSSSADLANPGFKLSFEKVLRRENTKHSNIDLPVNFYLGIENNFADLKKKSFILGVSVKL